MYRAAVSSPAFWAARTLLCSDPDSLDAKIAGRKATWHQDSIMVRLIENHNAITSMGIRVALEPFDFIQRTVAMALHALRSDPVPGLLSRRARRWLDDASADDVKVIHSNLTRLAKLVPPRVTFAVLKTICNGWCTTRRYQNEVIPCWFCDLDEGDDIEHYLDCGVLHAFASGHVADGWWPGGCSAALRRGILAVPLSNQDLIVTAAIIDAALQSHNAARANRHCASAYQLFSGRWRALLRTSPNLEKALRDIRMPFNSSSTT